jgi:hypothetical protein
VGPPIELADEEDVEVDGEMEEEFGTCKTLL